MNSLIREQHVERRPSLKGSERRASIPVREIISNVSFFQESSGTQSGSPRLMPSADKVLNPVLTKRAAVRPGDASAYENLLSGFPGTGASARASRERTAQPGTQLREEISPTLSPFNGLDLMFFMHAFMALVLLALLIARGNGLTPVAYATGPSLPGVETGSVILSLLGEPAQDGTASMPLEIDPDQFSALEVGEYVVQSGDTLGQIALDHDLSMDTLISFNQISDVRRMMPGDIYKIPNRNGLLHEVRNGESLSLLADRYGTTVNAILDANSLASEVIQPSQTLFIPGARMNDTDLRLALGELFIFPTSGRFTSGFGYRPDPFTGIRRFHNGVDWANRVGTPIKASMSGTVAHVETQIGNYGKFIIITHPRGFQSLYAHMDSISVRVGSYVSQGQVIGTMGNTGRSTGSHLHFTLFRNGNPVDPLDYLH